MLRTRDALRRALLALLERKQLEQISIRDIAAEAGIGYATFFRHHASKEELLNEIAEEQIAQLMGLAMPLLDAEDTRVSCLALCRYIHQHRAIWSALLTGGAAATLRQEFIRLSQIGVDRIRSRDSLPVELGVVFGVSATVEILTWWLRHPDEYTDAQVAEFLDRLVVAPTIGRAPQAQPAPGTRTAKR
jgi:AcrR family transcriptional regulator